MSKYTYTSKAAAHTVTGDVVIVPDQVDEDQRGWDDSGASFPVLRRDGSKARAIVRGDLYGLNAPGTGDMVVSII